MSRLRRHPLSGVGVVVLLSTVVLSLAAGCADGTADLARQTCEDLQARGSTLTPEQAWARVMQAVVQLPSRDNTEPFLREMWRLCPDVVPDVPKKQVPLESVGIEVTVTECSDQGASGVITSRDERILDLTFDILYTTDDGTVVTADEGLKADVLTPGVSRQWQSRLGDTPPDHTHCEFVLTEAWEGCC